MTDFLAELVRQTSKPGRWIAALLGCSLILAWYAGNLENRVEHLEQQLPATYPSASASPAPRPSPSRASRTGVRRPAPRPSTPSTRPVKDAHDPVSSGRGVPAGGAALLEVTCYTHTGNRTASGAWPRVGMAAGNRWPFGTRLHVEGIGEVTITDRIGHGSELDLFRDTRTECIRFGRQRLLVRVVA